MISDRRFLAVPLWLHAASRRSGEALVDRVLLVRSDGDAYCPEGVETAYPGLDLDTDVVTGGGHLDPDSGYGAWPAMLDWCRDPATRITSNTRPAGTPGVMTT